MFATASITPIIIKKDHTCKSFDECMLLIPLLQLLILELMFGRCASGDFVQFRIRCSLTSKILYVKCG